METRRFRDRTEAGRLLAQRLRSYAGRVRELLERAEGGREPVSCSSGADRVDLHADILRELDPHAVGCHHKKPESLPKSKTGPIAQPESMAARGLKQSSDRDRVVARQRLYVDQSTEDAAFLELDYDSRRLSTLLGELRKGLCEVGRAYRRPMLECLRYLRCPLLIVEVRK
jgi:hypothetical protein